MEELIQKFTAVDENGTPHDLQVYQSEISVARALTLRQSNQG